MNRKPTPVKLPDELKAAMESAAQEYEGNLSAAIRAAMRFWLEYRNREQELQRPVAVTQNRLPWLEEKPQEKARQVSPARQTGAVWTPGTKR